MIQTVRGWVENDTITGVLPHEHIYSDLRPLALPLDNGIFYDEVSLKNHGALTRNPYAVLDNAWLNDKTAAEEEMEALKKLGCNLIAEVTTEDFGQDVMALKELSEKTDMNIVLGCGYYTDLSVPEEVKAQSVSDMKKRIVKDLTEGINDTGIKAGVIGEIGTGMEMAESEKKFVQAAAQAQEETGFAMHIHASLWTREGLNALDLAVKNGAKAERICIDHSDVLLDEEYMLGIVDRGAYIEFDNFGKEFYVDRCDRNVLFGSFAPDKERVKMLKKLIDRGYTKQILITNDICIKSMLKNYGGWGYEHIFKNIIPMMEDFEISKADIDMITRQNPIRFLERK